ncbi:MAG: S8 family serine peptidase [Pirellulales bacterium]
MKKPRRKTAASRNSASLPARRQPPRRPQPPPAVGEGLTGRYLVTFRDQEPEEGIRLLGRCVGAAHVARTSDFAAGAPAMRELEQADAVVFDKLGVAVVSAPPDAAQFLAAVEEAPAIQSVEPERIMHALSAGPIGPGVVLPPTGPSLEYLRGYRDGVNALFSQLSGGSGGLALAEPCAAFADTEQATWGLQATRVVDSRASGRSIRLAVLDTGVDLRHADLAGRAIESESFISGEPPQDGHGHGTHCIGTACGPRRPADTRRYGVAYSARIFAGKVLSNAGSGADAGILAGIDWAVTNRCQVISMSLGATAPPSDAYETVARRAMAAGTLIIAAAGNEGSRAISRPANSPSIMAVGALDSALRVAEFSNWGAPSGGGQIDIAAPGVHVYSAWPEPARYRTISGTSMATPHVAGIAALWSQTRKITGAALWQALAASAQRLPQPSLAVGAGLAQAP